MVKDSGRSRSEGQEKFTLGYAKSRIVFKGDFTPLKYAFMKNILIKSFQGFQQFTSTRGKCKLWF